MPEYLSPGVYVEETTFRSKSIEGVATSTTGYAGLTRFGPVRYQGGSRSTEPRLVTSFTEFERIYGGLTQLAIDRGDGVPTSECYLAHAARAFFLNGGKRLYISRVYAPPDGTGVATSVVNFPNDSAVWTARWPGAFGEVLLRVRPQRRRNVGVELNGIMQAKGLGRGAIVEVTAPSPTLRRDDDDLIEADLRVIDVDVNGMQTFLPTAPNPGDVIREVTLRVDVLAEDGRLDSYVELACHPAQRRWIGKILQADDPEDENAIVCLHTDAPIDGQGSLTRALQLMLRLETPKGTEAVAPGIRLGGGSDGALPAVSDLSGEDADPDNANLKATGLAALGEIDDIAIIALPDAGAYADPDVAADAAGALVSHAELDRYRIAVVDAQQGSSMTEIRNFRGRFDSTYAALYHPWIEIFDPLERPAQGAPPRRILLPPSGFVTGIYARSDVERGVFKAPANEVVRGLTRLEANINTARQDVLNPEGINALRFFEGRGNRVWGARTMSSDPEWRYVNVRRFFIYLEHSIDKAMQFAVFEPNGPRLWTNIRRTVEDLLFTQWQSGALLGSKPEEAFFVACDRTTMTQLDLDSGRLICLIGVAPTKPAEFVIFRIGQWTADASIV